MDPDDPNNKYFLRSYLRYGWIQGVPRCECDSWHDSARSKNPISKKRSNKSQRFVLETYVKYMIFIYIHTYVCIMFTIYPLVNWRGCGSQWIWRLDMFNWSTTASYSAYKYIHICICIYIYTYILNLGKLSYFTNLNSSAIKGHDFPY